MKAPTAKYRLKVEITGNSHEEIEHEIAVLLNGGYLMDSSYHQRHEFNVVGGTTTRILEHINPDMTPDRYRSELSEWWEERKRGRS